MRILFFVLIALFIASLFIGEDGDGKSDSDVDWMQTFGDLLGAGSQLAPEDLLLAGRSGDRWTLKVATPVQTRIRASDQATRRGRIRLQSGQALQLRLEPADDDYLPTEKRLTPDKPTVDITLGKGGGKLLLVAVGATAEKPVIFAIEDAE